jgi:hypothetical protein
MVEKVSMKSDKQIKANQANSKLSTGPKTPAGKAKARYNAMKHGLLAEAALLPDEDEATFRDFTNKITADLEPSGEMESILVERVINTLWRLCRVSHVETGLFVRESALDAEERFRADARALEVTVDEWLDEQSALTSRQPVRILNEEWHQEANVLADEAAQVQRTPLGQLAGAFARDAAAGNAFSKLARYETQLNRTLERTLKQLDDLQQKRAQGETTN